MKLKNNKLISAAFQLHLTGSARIWLECLDTQDWHTIHAEFVDKYINISQSDLILGTEKYQNIFVEIFF